MPDVRNPEATAAVGRLRGRDFIRQIVADDLAQGRHGGRVVTRFPPEPNGYLHIGHAKAIALNFDIADEAPGGRYHLRFDDTNPETEDEHYVRSIIDSVSWLGYDWGDHLYFASDYFEHMYRFAEHLIRTGHAYVDSQSEEQIREGRGTVTEPGVASPFRDRSAEESLDLFRRMRAGEFPNGAHVLRGRIDMGSPNMLMRDPVLYRIRHASHYRTGDDWCIYPLYDYAHPIEDALECITHSLCTLEFEINREIYDWVIDHLPRGEGEYEIRPECRPRQYEFARGELDYTIMSKRKLLELVKGGHVAGWDDPRMPTLAGLRRRGVTPEAVRAFWEMAGVTKARTRVDISKLEFAIRDDLNVRVPRVLCVLRPLKLTVTNWTAARTEWLDAPLYPHDVPLEGSRALPFSGSLFIERDDFAEQPPRGWRRLSPGAEVRLRYGYLVRCDEVVKDETGEVVELRCSYDPETRGGEAADGRKVQGTIHWVDAEHSLPCEVRLYDRLFTVPDPEAGVEDFKVNLNADSLVVLDGARIEPSVAADPPGTRYQFERQGFFVSDIVDSAPGALVFNRTVTLRDTWAKKAEATLRRGEAATRREVEAAPKPAAVAGERTIPSRSPELEARWRWYVEELGLRDEDAEILTRDAATAELFDEARVGGASAGAVANWIVHELPRARAEAPAGAPPLAAAALGQLVELLESAAISSSAGREVLAEVLATGAAPADVVERRGLRQVSDPEQLWPMVEAVLNENPAKVDEYRAGKSGLLGFFVGQVMRKTEGRADPAVVKELLTNRLG